MDRKNKALNTWQLRLLWHDTKGAAMVEYALVLVILSIAIWITINWLNSTVVSYIGSVAQSYGSAATSTLPSIAVPDTMP